MSSKLIQQYQNLKKQDASSIYLFRVGIFYNILNEDAKVVNEKLGLKITDLGPNIFKCGFPIKQLEKYKTLMEQKELKFKIIDNLPNSTSVNDYMNNIEIKQILNKIYSLDLNNTTFHDAFNILLDTQNKLKNIVK